MLGDRVGLRHQDGSRGAPAGLIDSRVAYTAILLR